MSNVHTGEQSGWVKGVRTVDPQKITYAPGHGHDTTPSALGLEANQAARLERGDFLLVYNRQCWQVKRNGDVIKLFVLRREGDFTLWTAFPRKDGRIYCTASGSMSQTAPIQYAQFGHWGELVVVNHVRREIRSIAQLVDPLGVQFLSDAEVIVSDFNDWGGVGQIYRVHLPTGNLQKIAEGGVITEPYGAYLDRDGVLWIANADGLGYTGEIVRVNPDGTGKIVIPKRGLYSGVPCSIFASPSEDKLLGVMVDWPGLVNSCLFELDKKTEKMRVLLSTSPERPGVFSPQIAIDGRLVWLAEAYHNELVAFDLDKKKIVERLNIAAITGPALGIIDAWDFVESVAMVPEGYKQPDA